MDQTATPVDPRDQRESDRLYAAWQNAEAAYCARPTRDSEARELRALRAFCDHAVENGLSTRGF